MSCFEELIKLKFVCVCVCVAKGGASQADAGKNLKMEWGTEMEKETLILLYRRFYICPYLNFYVCAQVPLGKCQSKLSSFQAEFTF